MSIAGKQFIKYQDISFSTGVYRLHVCLLLTVLFFTGCFSGNDSNNAPTTSTGCHDYFEIYQNGITLENIYDNSYGIYIFSDSEANIYGGYDRWAAMTWENHTTYEFGSGTTQTGIDPLCTYYGCIDVPVSRWEATIPIIPGDNQITIYGDGCRDVVFTHLTEHAPKVKSFEAAFNTGQTDMTGLVETGGLATTITANYGRDETWQTSYKSLSESAVPDGRHVATSIITLTDYLLPGLPYYFRMTASNDLGSDTSNTITLTPPVDDPNQTRPSLYPNGGASFIDSYSASVSAMVWGHGAAYTAYVEYSDNPDFIDALETTRHSQSKYLINYVGESWRLSGLSANTTYYYRFVAYNSGGASVTFSHPFTTTP